MKEVALGAIGLLMLAGFCWMWWSYFTAEDDGPPDDQAGRGMF